MPRVQPVLLHVITLHYPTFCHNTMLWTEHGRHVLMNQPIIANLLDVSTFIYALVEGRINLIMAHNTGYTNVLRTICSELNGSA